MPSLIPFNRRNSIRPKGGFDDIYNMLDDFFSDSLSTRSLKSDTFKLDIKEKDENYLIEAELPGVKKDEIELNLDQGRLTIGVKREEKEEEEKENYIHKERRYSSMKRSVYLGNVDKDNIKASLEEGVLNIDIPKDSKDDPSKNIPID